ncbi:MAG: cell division protein ZipA C-terminal FtsZ-binding domain-containing protein [Brachymonas sp.]|nr:cell division protein ZipA C-terminal FtsZ-binding domain-containing protein [Brachymonas sp.]
MSISLQLGLAVAGGVVLAGLVAHNVWEARKNQPRQAEPDAAATGTALADDAAVADPAAIGQSAPRFNSSADAASALGEASAHSPDWAAQGPSPSHVAVKKPLDPLIDAIASIELDAGAVVSGETALAALPASRRVGDKPFAVEGRNSQSQQWEPPQAGQQYDAFQAGVQLANRSGALNEIGFSEFTLKAQAFADGVNGTPHFPDMIDEVARARELDQFASANDARLSFVLRARAAAWSTGYLHQVAAGYGFVAGALPGRLVLPSANVGEPPVLSLEFDTQAALADDVEQAVVREVLLCLDIAQVPPEQQPFARMCELAQELAKKMEGTVIDGNGYRIDSVAMEAIGKDVEDLYLLLAQRDFNAGSVLARRLFS